MGYVDTQNAWFKTPMIFIGVVAVVFFIGYGLGINTNPSESERVENLERTLFDSQGNQRVVESVSIVKDNSTHGHLKIEPSVGIGTIREIWVYKAISTSLDLQNDDNVSVAAEQLSIPSLGPIFLLEESFAPSPFTKVTSTFPVEIAEEDAFYVLIRFSDKDVEYVETFFVRQE